jgi:dTDP-4-dehydrorhamnose reductase
MVLVTGASGSLGWTLSRVLGSSCDVVAAYCSHPIHPDGTKGVLLDLRNPASIKSVLEEYRPETIFHLAAIANPDLCEKDPQTAYRVNSIASDELARYACGARAKLVFASTDLVFDGKRGGYREEDEPHPLSVYGETKVRAERVVLDRCPSALVMRSSLIYGIGSPVSETFLGSLLRTLARGEKMRLFVDQKRNPILVDDLARAMIEGVNQDLAGLYHVGGGEVVNRFEFGKMVCDAFGYDQSLLVPIEMKDFTYIAARPLDSTLDITRFVSASGFEPTPLAVALRDLRETASF